MRLLIATGLYPPEIGGPATYTKILEEELPKYDIEVVVVSFSSVRKLPKVIRHIAYFFLVLQRGFTVDTIYALDPVSTGLPSLLAAKILRKRFWVRITGDYAWEQYVGKEDGKKGLVKLEEFQKNKYDFFTESRRKLEYLVSRSGDTIIVPSNFLKKIVAQWEVNQNNIKVIHNGFNGSTDYGKKEVLRELLQFQGKLILGVGRLISLKGFIGLIKTMPKLREKFPNLKLMIVGDGPQQEELEKIIKKLKLENTVILAGPLVREVLLRYIRTADIFVLNSIHETFPHVVLEAMVVGTPIIATKVGGIPEIVRHKKEALLVSPGDQKELISTIGELLKNPMAGRELVRKAKTRVKEFSEEKMITKFIQELKR